MSGQVYRVLTHVGWVTHICVSNLTIIGSDNGLAQSRWQAIIWTNYVILWIWPYGTNFSEISIELLTFWFKKMHFDVLSAKWRPLCLRLNELITGVNSSPGPLSNRHLDSLGEFTEEQTYKEWSRYYCMLWAAAYEFELKITSTTPLPHLKFNPSTDQRSQVHLSVGWNELLIPTLKRCNHWNLRKDNWFHQAFHNGCDYLSMLGLKSNLAS